jgi:hypothetical protein
MNVLPLVSAFLIIFAICSYSFVHNVRTIAEEKIHYLGSFRIQRKFTASQANRAYNKQKGKSLHTQPSRQAAASASTYHSPRDWQRKKDESKCNLRALLATIPPERLEEIALTVLRDLYFLAPFYREGLEMQILTTIKKILKEDGDLETFEDLLKKVPDEEFAFFYKLVKGTHRYQVSTTNGYPALGDFFSISPIKENTPPISFSHASRPLLNAVFGPTHAPLIINEEKHKWEEKKRHQPLTKQELEGFLLGKQLNPADYAPLLTFSNRSQSPPLEIIYDEETKLQIKIPL